jgi:hypothetical protein
VDFDLDKLQEIPDPYEAEAAAPSRPPPALSSPSPSRQAQARRRHVLLAVVLLLEAAWIARAGLAPRAGSTPAFALGAFGLPAAGAVLAWLAATRPGRLGLGLSPKRLVLALALTIALFAASALFTTDAALQPFTLSSTLACAATSVMLAGLPFAAGFYVFRRALPGSAWLRMAIVGVACGALGALLVRLHCPRESIPHIVLGHGAALILFGALGVATGQRVARL